MAGGLNYQEKFHREKEILFTPRLVKGLEYLIAGACFILLPGTRKDRHNRASRNIRGGLPFGELKQV